MITDEQKRIAERDIAIIEAVIEAVGKEIDSLSVKLCLHGRQLDELKLIRDGIDPCRACKRKVKSPCHNRASFHEHGPWDEHCRSVLYPDDDDDR